MEEQRLLETTPARLLAIIGPTDEAIKSRLPGETSKTRVSVLDPSSTTIVLVAVPLAHGTDLIARTNLQEKFQRLATQWRKETRHISSIHEKSMNMAYQKIIAMGRDALPFIFRDFQRTHDDWVWALQAITEAEPVSEQFDDFNEVVEAWLDWARKHDYLD